MASRWSYASLSASLARTGSKGRVVAAAGVVLVFGGAAACATSDPPSSPTVVAPSAQTSSSGSSDAGGAAQDSGGGGSSSVLTSQDSGVPVVLDSGVFSSSPSQVDSGAPASSAADSQCAEMSDDGCYTCCGNNHAGGSSIYNDAFYDCVCGPPDGTQGVCQTQCAQTDCSATGDAGSVSGDPCDTCETDSVGDGGACAATVNSACSVSADCVAYAACVNNCP